MEDRMQGFVDSWKPPQGVTTHSGTPVPNDLDFIIPPPAEIGEVLTCYSTLSRSKEPMGFVTRGLISSTVGGLVGGGVGWVTYALTEGDMTATVVVGLVAFLILFLIVFLMTGFKIAVTYVGKQGAVRYTIKGSRSANPREELLIFEDDLDLFTGQTHHYYNGVYTGTQYFFKWQDPNRKTVLNLKGTHNAKDGIPKPKDPFNFARMAEIAWSMFLLDAMQKELDQHGTVQFLVNRKDAVRVGQGFMEFEFGGKQERVEGEQLKHISIGGGTFSFKTNDAKWFSSKGKFSFNYASMANARCFLMVLQHLLGVTFQ